MVRQDGRAIPLGRAPDDHMQQPIGGLDVMFLGEEERWSDACLPKTIPSCPAIPPLTAASLGSWVPWEHKGMWSSCPGKSPSSGHPRGGRRQDRSHKCFQPPPTPEGKGREGKGREGKGREGKGREGKELGWDNRI